MSSLAKRLAKVQSDTRNDHEKMEQLLAKYELDDEKENRSWSDQVEESSAAGSGSYLERMKRLPPKSYQKLKEAVPGLPDVVSSCAVSSNRSDINENKVSVQCVPSICNAAPTTTNRRTCEYDRHTDADTDTWTSSPSPPPPPPPPPQSNQSRRTHENRVGRRWQDDKSTATRWHCAKRPSYTPEDETRLSLSIKDTYGAPLESFLVHCFSKQVDFRAPVSLYGKAGRPISPDTMFTTDKWTDDKFPELSALKCKLNATKEKLSEYDLNEWHRHTRSTNPANLVMRRLRSDVKVEFLTQAWCKFYEIMASYNLIPRSAAKKKDDAFYTMHLCEAPGAFVASLNHYLKLNHPDIKWYWRANSLNPFYEGNHLSAMINDDRFMLQTIENWDFGPDETGDITHPGYPDYLREKCGENLPHLVTADGSFDCQDKPEEQENLVSWLHFKEALLALNILRNGGHFVIKMFTFFECDTVCLLFLLKCCFQSVSVVKPATSKEGNSEVYVVCREFSDDKRIRPFVRRLISISEKQFRTHSMFSFDRISRPFYSTLLECAEKFANWQSSVIERNIRLYPFTHNAEIRKQFEYVQEKLFDHYVEKYEMKEISLDATVVRVPYRRNDVRFTPNKVIEEREYKQGSHNDQLNRSKMVLQQLLAQILRELQDTPTLKSQRTTIMPQTWLDPACFKIRTGKPIEAVHSSQFCHGTFMRMRNEIIKVTGVARYTIMALDEDAIEQLKIRYVNVCDFTDCAISSPVYEKYQSRCFIKLFDRLASLQEHEDLILYNFPLLTQFAVSILCILGQIFEKVKFESPSTLHLCNANDYDSYNTWMQRLQQVQKEYNESNAVISLLPTKCITGSDNPFYNWIIDVNNARVSHEIHRTAKF